IRSLAGWANALKSDTSHFTGSSNLSTWSAASAAWRARKARRSNRSGSPLGQAEAEARSIAEGVQNRLVLRNTTTWDGTMALTIFCWAAANLAVATVWAAYCLWPRRPAADASMNGAHRSGL